MNTRAKMTARFLELWDEHNAAQPSRTREEIMATMDDPPTAEETALWDAFEARWKSEFPGQPHSVFDAALTAAFGLIARRCVAGLREVLAEDPEP
jgi:hypothetical protein